MFVFGFRCSMFDVRLDRSMPSSDPPARPSLVVSLHDVSPATRAACEAIVEELRALGVGACSLLVIPDHHRRGHFLKDARFCEWLRELANAGHEAVMHGYFHRRARRDGESTLQKLTTRVYTSDEGEFYDLDRTTARELVARAQADFAQLGLAPRGFIAPAWLLGAEAAEALRELGIAYTTRLAAVFDLRSGATHRSQSLVWSVRSAWRRAVSLAWNAQLFRQLAANPLMRISIHPVDLAHPRIWRQVRRLTAAALAMRTARTYAEWIGCASDA
jgi:hypothetical protein